MPRQTFMGRMKLPVISTEPLYDTSPVVPLAEASPLVELCPECVDRGVAAGPDERCCETST